MLGLQRMIMFEIKLDEANAKIDANLDSKSRTNMSGGSRAYRGASKVEYMRDANYHSSSPLNHLSRNHHLLTEFESEVGGNLMRKSNQLRLSTESGNHVK